MRTIGIRHEDKSKWEVRAPLVPEHVRQLVAEHGLAVCVQKSDQRVYPEDAYAAVGARIVDQLNDCDVILGVKEVPLDQLRRGKTYVFFSHTIKGQDYNMPLLNRLLELQCDLIDYERIVDEQSRRLVFFGYHAGLAGMIDSLWALGQRLAIEGRDTALARLKPAHQYDDLDDALAHLRASVQAARAGDHLTGLGPIVVGFAGYGQVSQGAQKVFECCAPKTLEPEALAGLDAHESDGEFFKVVFREAHMVHPRPDAGPFALQDYYDHPEHYVGVFDRYLAHLTVLVNCIYWEPKYPRLVTLDALNHLYGTYAKSPQPRLRVIGDISCDVGGSIECTVRATDPGNPVYVYDVSRHEAVDGFSGRGPVMMAVDILPTELPRDASQAFSDALVGLVPGLAAAPPVARFADWDLPLPLKRAAIVHRGELTPDYAYLREYLG
jgi:alanine dehydrogenase